MSNNNKNIFIKAVALVLVGLMLLGCVSVIIPLF